MTRLSKYLDDQHSTLLKGYTSATTLEYH